MSKVVGIDLGTTNSVVAIVEGGDPIVIPSAEGGRLIAVQEVREFGVAVLASGDAQVVASHHAKARHLEPYRMSKIIFAGDGHSDLDAALAADVVFAKASLARELDSLGTTFYPFETLDPVLAYLQTTETALIAPVVSLRA